MNPVLPIAEAAASSWSNLPALKMRCGAGTNCYGLQGTSPQALSWDKSQGKDGCRGGASQPGSGLGARTGEAKV